MRDSGSDVSRYVAGLDGLRALACLGVLASHALTHLTPGAVPVAVAAMLASGVTVFFVLSGFLIYLPFVEAIVGDRPEIGVRHYLKRRVLRIYPLFLVVFLIADFGVRAVYVGNEAEVGSPGTLAGTGLLSDPEAVLANLSLTAGLIPDFLQTGIPPAWSLTTELCFYLVVPALAFAVRGRAGHRLTWAAVPPMLLIVVAMIARASAEAWWVRDGREPFATAEFGSHGLAVLSQSLAVYADNFAVGMLVAIAYVWTRRDPARAWAPRVATATALGLVLAGAVLSVLVKESHHWFVSSALGIAAGGAVLAVSDPAARGASTVLARLAAVRPLPWLGEISYGIYLWHFPVIVVALRAGWDPSGSLARALLGVALTAAAASALAAITYLTIERPAMRWAGKARVSR